MGLILLWLLGIPIPLLILIALLARRAEAFDPKRHGRGIAPAMMLFRRAARSSD
jgi:hypothetical protein